MCFPADRPNPLACGNSSRIWACSLLLHLERNPELTMRTTLPVEEQRQIIALASCSFNSSSPNRCLFESYPAKGQTGSSSVIIPFLLSAWSVARRFTHDRANVSFQLFSIDELPEPGSFLFIDALAATSSLPRI